MLEFGSGERFHGYGFCNMQPKSGIGPGAHFHNTLYTPCPKKRDTFNVAHLL